MDLKGTRARARGGLIASAVWALVGVPAALAGAVALDTSFGGDGLVETAVSSVTDQARDVLVRPDGKIVAAGFTGSSGGAIVVAQYEADGDLDPTFDGDGIAAASVPGVFVYANAIARQTDGAVVVAGSTQTFPNGQDFALARFLANGNLDPTFGVGGIVIVNLGLGFFETARAVEIQPDGKILVAGDAGTGVVARFLPTGQLDASFGSGGIASVGPGVIEDLALDQTGRILTAGWQNFGFPRAADFVVSRLASSGELDATFGGTGSVVTDFPSQDSSFNSDVPRQVLAGAGGSVVVVGWSMPQGFSPFATDFIAARYLANGTLDGSFGSGGKARTHIGGDDRAEAAVIDADGSIVAVGWTGTFGFPTFNKDLALVRYTVDGQLDSTFDDDGIATAGSAPDFEDVAEAAALDTDGRLVVVGWNEPRFGSLRPTGADFLAARFLLPSFDTAAPTIRVSDLTVPATRPDGADVAEYEVEVTDNVDPNPTVICTPPAPATFPIGTTVVTCTATDDSGNSAQASFSVHVKGADEQLDDLLAQVAADGLGPGSSLARQAAAARASLSAGNQLATCRILTAFSNEARAQSGKTLTPEQAAELIEVANRIRAVLDC